MYRRRAVASWRSLQQLVAERFRCQRCQYTGKGELTEWNDSARGKAVANKGAGCRGDSLEASPHRGRRLAKMLCGCFGWTGRNVFQKKSNPTAPGAVRPLKVGLCWHWVPISKIEIMTTRGGSNIDEVNKLRVSGLLLDPNGVVI